MKKLFILCLAIVYQFVFSQDTTGSWKGELEIQGTNLPLIFHISKDGNSYKSTMDSPMQGAKGLVTKSTTYEDGYLTIDASTFGITYKGKFSNNEIEGTFLQGGLTLPLKLKKTTFEENALNRPQTPKPPINYNNEEVTFKNEKEGNLLAGTLTTPKNFSKKSVVLVMITGSGTQNRDYELFGHKAFLVIADDFAQKGIATLRLDDRGIGGSEKGKEGATSADVADDISSAVNFLASRNYSNIGLIGHSEGGMISQMVAVSNKSVKFLVLTAAPGIEAIEVMVKQAYDIGKTSGLPEDALNHNKAFNKKIYTYVAKYKGKNLEQDLKQVMTDVLKKMSNGQMSYELIEKTASEQAKALSNPWYRYFIAFNPDIYLSTLKIPILALNGSLDLQVSAKENLEGIKKSLTKAGNKNFDLVECDGLNHLFQTAKTGSPSEYGQIEETIAPKVLDIMSNWILKNAK